MMINIFLRMREINKNFNTKPLKRIKLKNKILEIRDKQNGINGILDRAEDCGEHLV